MPLGFWLYGKQTVSSPPPPTYAHAIKWAADEHDKNTSKELFI